MSTLSKEVLAVISESSDVKVLAAIKAKAETKRDFEMLLAVSNRLEVLAKRPGTKGVSSAAWKGCWAGEKGAEGIELSRFNDNKHKKVFLQIPVAEVLEMAKEIQAAVDGGVEVDCDKWDGTNFVAGTAKLSMVRTPKADRKIVVEGNVETDAVLAKIMG